MFAGLKAQASAIATTAVAPAASQPVVEIATTPLSTADALPASSRGGAAWQLLGAILSVLAAINLMLYRHLRQIYAPRRRAVRRT